MKDKKCKDFVFMPLGEGVGNMTAKVSQTSSDSSSKDKKNRPITDSLGLATASTEVKSKIVLVGSCACGKTALIQKYTQNKFVDTYSPTGFDTYTTNYNVSDTYRIQMSIWDTSGAPGYDRVRPLSYSEADLVIICFAIDRPDTLEEVTTKWFPEVKKHCPNQPVMLVGCKSDRRAEMKNQSDKTQLQSSVTYDQGLRKAKEINALVYSETSSKTSQRSVNDVMEVAALSSAGSKNGASFTASAAHGSGTTTTASNSSTGSSANSSSSDSPNFRRHRSFIRRKRFNGMNEAKTQLRTEAAKSCAIM